MNIKEMRLKRDFSQAMLSKVSGVNLRSLQDYEQGHKSLAGARGETLYRLSQALGYSIEDILADHCRGIDIQRDVNDFIGGRIAAYERALDKRNNKNTRFPVIFPDNKVDMSRIYPTKQKSVKGVIDQLRGDDRLNTIRLFGSSITIRCHRDSDLDFAVGLKNYSNFIKNEISEKIQLACNWEADIIWLDRVTEDDRIYNDIMNGLVII